MSLPRREISRQLVHFAMGLFAFALAFLTRPQAIVMAGIALLGNLLVLPRLRWTRPLFRPGEVRWGGIVLYPVVVLLLVALFPYPVVPAGAWSILAAGDAASGLVGGGVGGRTLPYHSRKTWAGSLAFIIAATAWSTFVLTIAFEPPFASVLAVCAVASVGAALVESLPIPIDDNLSVGIVAALLLTWGMTWTS